MRVLYSQPVARGVAVLASVVLVEYLHWRLTATLNADALAFSLLLLAAEAQGILTFLLFALMTWDVRRPPRPPLREGLRVDVYVPTYDEDLEILEATLTGCGRMAYPHATYVLDDGRRPEVAALAARLGCRYLTRPDNRDAKAGNLNAALPRTDGDFIAVLDADMVPQPDFLTKTLGYFTDPEVALVQLPQEFYNRDSVQHAAGERGPGPWHEQELFYRVIQPGKNRWNAAFWCGSPSVLRRAALEAVGGVATETVTEDIHTSLRLHARGWKTVYHDEALAFGIAPQTLHAFAIQRLRWAQGTMQLLRSRENPLLVAGLSLAQRLNYLASMLTYFDSYQKLVFLVAPPFILLTGILPLDVGGREFAARWSVYFAAGLLANVALGRGRFHYVGTEQYNFLKLFTFLWASTVLVWPRRLRFQVTPKQVAGAVYRQERRHLRPHAVALGLVGLAVAVGAGNLQWQVTASYTRPDLILVTIAWALAGAGLLGLGVVDVLRRRHDRQHYRFPVEVEALVAAPDGAACVARVENLSRSGAGVLAAGGAAYA